MDSAALERMKRYRWPGNIRELENLIRRLAALYPQEVITEPLIEAELGLDAPVSPLAPTAHSGRRARRSRRTLGARNDAFAFGRATISRAVQDPSATTCRRPASIIACCARLEYPLISAALAATRGNQIKAAELLGLNRNTLRKKVRDLDIRMMRSRADAR